MGSPTPATTQAALGGEFFWGGDGVGGAGAGDAEGGGAASVGESGEGIGVLEKFGEKKANEGVASGGGIDGLYGESGNVMKEVLVEVDGALGTKGQDGCRVGMVMAQECVYVVGVGLAGETFGFSLVEDEEIDVVQRITADGGSHGGGVEYDPQAVLFGALNGIGDRVGFILDQEGVAGGTGVD